MDVNKLWKELFQKKFKDFPGNIENWKKCVYCKEWI